MGVEVGGGGWGREEGGGGGRGGGYLVSYKQSRQLAEYYLHLNRNLLQDRLVCAQLYIRCRRAPCEGTSSAAAAGSCSLDIQAALQHRLLKEGCAGVATSRHPASQCLQRWKVVCWKFCRGKIPGSWTIRDDLLMKCIRSKASIQAPLMRTHPQPALAGRLPGLQI